MSYYPGFAYFLEPVTLAGLLAALVDELDPVYRVIIQHEGSREGVLYEQAVAVKQALKERRQPVRSIVLLAPFQQVELSLTPGGYLALDVRGFAYLSLDDEELSVDEEQTRNQRVADLLCSLVRVAGARLAYISQGASNSAGPVTPDAQSAQVFVALAKGNAAALSQALWSRDAPLPQLLVLAHEDLLVQAAVAEQCWLRRVFVDGMVDVLELV